MSAARPGAGPSRIVGHARFTDGYFLPLALPRGSLPPGGLVTTAGGATTTGAAAATTATTGAAIA